MSTLVSAAILLKFGRVHALWRGDLAPILAKDKKVEGGLRERSYCQELYNKLLEHFWLFPIIVY